MPHSIDHDIHDDVKHIPHTPEAGEPAHPPDLARGSQRDARSPRPRSVSRPEHAAGWAEYSPRRSASPSSGAGTPPPPQSTPPARKPSRFGRLASRRALGALGIVTWLVVFAAVIALGVAVVDHLTHANDLALERQFQATHSPVLLGLLDWISAIGYPLQSGVIVLAAVATLWVLRYRLEAVFIALANVADAISDIVKHLVDRHRPLPNAVHVFIHLHTPSFPSGHTVHYTAFYGMLIVVILARFRPSLWRWLWVAFFAFLIVLVGPSRVYLGEHWPSDVLAGYAIGLLWLAPLSWAYAWMRAHPRRIPYTGWLYPAVPPRSPRSDASNANAPAR